MPQRFRGSCTDMDTGNVVCKTESTYLNAFLQVFPQSSNISWRVPDYSIEKTESTGCKWLKSTEMCILKPSSRERQVMWRHAEADPYTLNNGTTVSTLHCMACLQLWWELNGISWDFVIHSWKLLWYKTQSDWIARAKKKKKKNGEVTSLVGNLASITEHKLSS